MATKVLNSRPNGSPQYIQNFEVSSTAAVTTLQAVGHVWAWDTQEFGDNSSIDIEAWFNTVNNANNKILAIQASNTPDFAAFETIGQVVAASADGQKLSSSIVILKGASFISRVGPAGQVLPSATIRRDRRLYLRAVVTKATGADAVSLQGVRFTLRREMYEYKYDVNLAS